MRGAAAIGEDAGVTPRHLVILPLLLAAACHSTPPAPVGHRVLLQGNERLAIVARDGSIEWEMPWGGIHDVHRLPDGHLLVQKGAAVVAEIDPSTKAVVWSYDAATANGNAGQRVEVHSFVPLGDGKLLVAESGPSRFVEIDRAGNLLHVIPMTVAQHDAHRDTRLVRRLADGHVLASHEGDGCVREYDRDGHVVWQFAVPLFGRERRDGHGAEAFGNAVFDALRLPSGHTLVATGNGHSVLEVDRGGAIVWSLQQNDLPGITLAWVTTLEVLPNGHYVVGNCHAGPGQPVLVEGDPATKRVVWQLDGYERFGNSVSNSLLLDVAGLR